MMNQAAKRQSRKAAMKRYEKTKPGFLMRLYCNMKGRVNGTQRHKFHLYAGCKILSKEEFYKWANDSEEFHKLFREWESVGYPMKLTPSVDRKDPFYGYELFNMEWVTHSINSSRANKGRR